ncbi:hypothetical protein [Fodinibius sediminis]|uniref:Uncharacterized protein n=1 Tax=Fodinibius sediminis TaxID=1214077 RepID=A0A521CVD8_9BACT|nr:hypothetical protein [Fodinibius sediminis]SMO63429.1 hypothetical protein SAMN06265218_107143 [Fodinibius sediminis]
MDTPKKKQRTLKIKLSESNHLKEYEDELERWESEGGRASTLNDIFDEVKLPLKPGEVFEVTDGNVIYEDGEYYYMIDIDLLSLY